MFPPSLLPLSRYEKATRLCRINIHTGCSTSEAMLAGSGTACISRSSFDELDYFLPIGSIRLSTGIFAIYNDVCDTR